MVLRGEFYEAEDMREGEKRERGREEWQTEAWEERTVLGNIYGGRGHDWFGDGRRGKVGKVSPLTQRIESCTTDL